jgi:hypothetical protein
MKRTNPIILRCSRLDLSVFCVSLCKLLARDDELECRPCGSLAVAQIRQPCPSTIGREIASPIPVPSGSVV